MNLAIHNLLQDKLRFVLSVTGVALAVMLILFLLGLRQGMFRSAVIYLDHAPGSVAVMPVGVKSTNTGSGQFLSPQRVEEIAAAPGVARVTPVLQMTAIPAGWERANRVSLPSFNPMAGSKLISPTLRHSANS